jgi:hypothetical protein
MKPAVVLSSKSLLMNCIGGASAFCRLTSWHGRLGRVAKKQFTCKQEMHPTWTLVKIFCLALNLPAPVELRTNPDLMMVDVCFAKS